MKSTTFKEISSHKKYDWHVNYYVKNVKNEQIDACIGGITADM